MTFFGNYFETKKDLRKEISLLTKQLHELDVKYDKLLHNFPYELGQTLYEVKFKDSKGRYTKTNPSKAHCEIVLVTVDENNYFSLKDRDVFLSHSTAEAYIKYKCRNECAATE